MSSIKLIVSQSPLGVLETAKKPAISFFDRSFHDDAVYTGNDR